MVWTTRLAMAGAICLAAQGAGAEAGRPGPECLPAPYDAARTDGERRIAELVGWLRPALGPYPSLLAALETSAPEICLAAALFGAEGYLGVEENRIVLRRSLPRGLMRAVMLHELRHLHQVRVGACPGPDLSMQETARVTLALEADASAVSLAVAWGLREDGDALAWQALASWPTHVDLAEAFEAEMRESGDVARATARAFAQWYVSDWRRETYRLAACSDYLDRQDRTHALPRYGAAAPDYLDSLCRMPDGGTYPCEEPGDGAAQRPE